jgi:hypothetical protein
MEELTTAQRTLNATTVAVASILTNPRLSIPHYQRPYKWQQRHVAQLMEDIQRFQNKSAYRLGSLVLHENEGKLDIVDGQQRTISLALILRAFMNHHPQVENLKLRPKLKALEASLFNPELPHPLSQKNISENYRFIEQRIHNLEEETILFLLDKCEFVQFTLQDLSSAFQFFDAQNARGKDLEPHDLLKAYHLRAFSDRDEALKETVIAKWENTDTKKLAGLFRYFLYRIKSWSNYQSARFFSKANVDLFKGVDLDHSRDLPFTQIIRLADVYTRTYNRAVDRKLDGQEMNFPFQLEMPVVNGRMFFEMVKHYLKQSETMWKQIKEQVSKNSKAEKVIDTLETYSGRQRDGDKYLRQLFDAALLQYIDKFGYNNIETVLCHLFVWSYRLRLEKQRVQLASMDNHAFAEDGYLHVIRKALKPDQVTMTPYPMHIDLNYERTKELQSVFKLVLGENIFNNG